MREQKNNLALHLLKAQNTVHFDIENYEQRYITGENYQQHVQTAVILSRTHIFHFPDGHDMHAQ